jgi:hypothetical protein
MLLIFIHRNGLLDGEREAFIDKHPSVERLNSKRAATADLTKLSVQVL